MESQYRLALLAKDIIVLDACLGRKLEMVERPLEPIYKEKIIVSSAQSEREPNARNAQKENKLAK